MLFSSDRNGNGQIFRQALGNGNAELVAFAFSKSAVLLRESGWELAADFYDGGSFKPHVGATANADQWRTFGAGTDGAERAAQYRTMLGSPGEFMRAGGANPGSQAADSYGV